MGIDRATFLVRSCGGAIALSALALACFAPAAVAAPSRALLDLERILEAERSLTFTTYEVTIDYPLGAPALTVRSFVTVSEGRRIEKVIETNVEPESEGSRGSSSPIGPADLETIPVPLFPDGLGDLDRIGENYAFTPIDDKPDSGWRMTPRHHRGFPIEFEAGDKGPWTKITVFDEAGHVRVRRYRESLTLLPALDFDRQAEMRKRGRPALMPAGGGHVDEVLTPDEARRRLDGILLPTQPILGFAVTRIEAARDGATGAEVIFVTMSDGLLNMVLAMTRVLARDGEAVDRSSASNGGDVGTANPGGTTEAPGGRLIVRKSSDHSDSGISVYQWTETDGFATLLLSSIPAADSRRFIEELAASVPRR